MWRKIIPATFFVVAACSGGQSTPPLSGDVEEAGVFFPATPVVALRATPPATNLFLADVWGGDQDTPEPDDGWERNDKDAETFASETNDSEPPDSEGPPPCGQAEMLVAQGQKSSWHVASCTGLPQGKNAVPLPQVLVFQNLQVGELGMGPGQTRPLWYACSEKVWQGTLESNPCYMAYQGTGERFGLTGEPWNPHFLNDPPPAWVTSPIGPDFAALQNRMIKALGLDRVLPQFLGAGAATMRFSQELEVRDGYLRAYVVLWHPLLAKAWDGELYLPLNPTSPVGISIKEHGHEFPGTRYIPEKSAVEGVEGLQTWGAEYGAQDLARAGRAVLLMGTRPYLIMGFESESSIAKMLWEDSGMHMLTMTLLEDLVAVSAMKTLSWTDPSGATHTVDPEDFTIFGHSAGGLRVRVLATIIPPQRLCADYTYSATSVSTEAAKEGVAVHCEINPFGGGALEDAMEETERFPFDILEIPYRYWDLKLLDTPRQPAEVADLVRKFLTGWQP